MQKWYDGYLFDLSDDIMGGDSFPGDDFSNDGDSDPVRTEQEGAKRESADIILHVYSPNSVMEALNNRKFQGLEIIVLKIDKSGKLWYKFIKGSNGCLLN